MWYVIQVKTGDEVSVMKKLQELNIQAAVPIENRPTRKSGSWTLKEYVLFPGYVFLNIHFNAEYYYKVVKIPSVIRFLGESSHPSTLTYLEAEWIKILSGSGGTPIEPTKVKESENGEVEIVEGILAQFANRVIKYDKHSRKATFELTICNEVKEVQLGIELVEQ